MLTDLESSDDEEELPIYSLPSVSSRFLSPFLWSVHLKIVSIRPTHTVQGGGGGGAIMEVVTMQEEELRRNHGCNCNSR